MTGLTSARDEDKSPFKLRSFHRQHPSGDPEEGRGNDEQNLRRLGCTDLFIIYLHASTQCTWARATALSFICLWVDCRMIRHREHCVDAMLRDGTFEVSGRTWGLTGFVLDYVL